MTLFLRRPCSSLVIVCFLFSSLYSQTNVFAASGSVLGLPDPGVMVSLSPAYAPALIKGLRIHPENPLLFDFIVDTGHSGLTTDTPQLRAESEKLIKYFLATLTVPEKDLWVNLSPYEKDRMIPKELGQTEMGRDMLAQDYLLKQLTASLIYPEKELGKKFWDSVYAKAQQIYGSAEVPVNGSASLTINTFNKVWILPDKAGVFVRNNTVYVVEGHLKVMLEEDYLALEKNELSPTLSLTKRGGQSDSPSLFSKRGLGGVASDIVRDIILPELEKEVNQGKNFAPLRQIFYSLILASWYKKHLKDALLNQVYSDKNKVNGVHVDDKDIGNKIYQQYLAAYKKGVFNYIKEDVDRLNKQVLPRKYFSGGLLFRVNPQEVSPAMVSPAMFATDGALFSVQASMPNAAMTITNRKGRPVKSPELFETEMDMMKTRYETLKKEFTGFNLSVDGNNKSNYIESLKGFHTRVVILIEAVNDIQEGNGYEERMVPLRQEVRQLWAEINDKYFFVAMDMLESLFVKVRKRVYASAGLKEVAEIVNDLIETHRTATTLLNQALRAGVGGVSKKVMEVKIADITRLSAQFAGQVYFILDRKLATPVIDPELTVLAEITREIFRLLANVNVSSVNPLMKEHYDNLLFTINLYYEIIDEVRPFIVNTVASAWTWLSLTEAKIPLRTWTQLRTQLAIIHKTLTLRLEKGEDEDQDLILELGQLIDQIKERILVITQRTLELRSQMGGAGKAFFEAMEVLREGDGIIVDRPDAAMTAIDMSVVLNSVLREIQADIQRIAASPVDSTVLGELGVYALLLTEVNPVGHMNISVDESVDEFVQLTAQVNTLIIQVVEKALADQTLHDRMDVLLVMKNLLWQAKYSINRNVADPAKELQLFAISKLDLSVQALIIRVESARMAGMKGSDAPSDPASIAKGGIDFNPANLTTSTTGEKIDIRFDKAMIAQFKNGDFTGVRPVILSVTPLPSVLPLLGLSPAKEQENT